MRKFIFVVLAALSLGLIAGCSNDEKPAENGAGEAEANNAAEVIKIGASATPHAEILEKAKELLADKNIDLDIVIFNDYVQPNLVVDSGELDANYFQHKPYLESFNEEHTTHLVSAGAIHYEPFGIYPGKSNDLNNIKENAVIAVPNDTTNEARALLLLQDNKLIQLKNEAGMKATVNDIKENPYKLEIRELEAAQLPRVKDEMDFVVLNGNYALEAGFSVAEDALAYEAADSQAAVEYANIVAVKEGKENTEKIKQLIRVLQSEEIKKFIEEKYKGAVIPSDN